MRGEGEGRLTDSNRSVLFCSTAGAKLVLPKGEMPQLRKLHGSATNLTSASVTSRPRGPPPPTPASAATVVALNQQALSRNGRSTESLSSAPSDGEISDRPAPPGRGSFRFRLMPLALEAHVPLRETGRRCRALYDCEADNDDEVSFREGEILVVLVEKTEDENWMEGFVEGDPKRRGVFPASFVHMLND